MSNFDPIKAAREELTGLADILTTIRQRERMAEAAISAAESELNAIRKLRGFCQALMTDMRNRIAKLETENS